MSGRFIVVGIGLMDVELFFVFDLDFEFGWVSWFLGYVCNICNGYVEVFMLLFLNLIWFWGLLSLGLFLNFLILGWF